MEPKSVPLLRARAARPLRGCSRSALKHKERVSASIDQALPVAEPRAPTGARDSAKLGLLH